jgi:glyoxylase-like metal-dependent hydrolase (beta-lactamase superfamily II)
VIELSEGQMLDFGLGLQVLFVPGHSPGHVAFWGQGQLMGGDVLFRGGIGRYDLPGSNGQDLAHSLKSLMALPPQTTVWPGHGKSTTIAHEAKTNPYLSELGLDAV